MLGEVGNIELVAELHRSPPSTFFQGRHRMLGSDVLVHRMAIDPERDTETRAAFFREQRHAAALNHPAILRPTDILDHGGFLWAVYEFHSWRTTDAILRRRGAAALVDVAGVGGQVADALAFMHRRGFVHGRLGPAEVAVGKEQRVFLLSFGKSAELALGAWPLRPDVLGLGPWSAPEEFRGERPTPSSDTYSLAALLLHWLTARYPRGGETPAEATERARAGAPVPDLAEMRPDVPHVLVEALRGCLHSDPEMRRGSAAALGSLLDEIHRRLVAEVPAGFEAGARLRLETEGRTVRILSRHGSGAFGVLFRARDAAEDGEDGPARGGRFLAVKALKPEHRTDPEARQRFLREAEAIHAIDHPNVVKVRGVGEHLGTPFVVMDFVEGADLSTLLLREGAMPGARAARLAAAIAGGLEAIHEQGVVHRDLKPQNVLVDATGKPVIADFGVAQQRTQPRLTLTGALVGTPAYMAPEQVAGEAATPSTDLYALGAILYEMLSGRPPFPARDTLSTMRAIAESPPPGLPAEIPGPLCETVMRLLAKRPEDRFSSASAVAERLDRMAETLEAETTRRTPDLALGVDH